MDFHRFGKHFGCQNGANLAPIYLYRCRKASDLKMPYKPNNICDFSNTLSLNFKVRGKDVGVRNSLKSVWKRSQSQLAKKIDLEPI